MGLAGFFAHTGLSWPRLRLTEIWSRRGPCHRQGSCPPWGSAPASLGSQPSVPRFPGSPTVSNVRPREEKIHRNQRSCRKDPVAWRWPPDWRETPGISQKQGGVFLERKQTDTKNRSNTSPETGLWTRDVPSGRARGGVRTDPQALHPCAGMIGGVPRGKAGRDGPAGFMGLSRAEGRRGPLQEPIGYT